MLHNYNHPADESQVRTLAQSGQLPEAFDALAQPLHEALYNAQSFDMLQTLTPAEELILCLDYIQMQVGQGGFIQLIQNGYVPLLVNVIEAAQKLGIVPGMQKLLDDVLKVYVLNKDALGKETTPEQFAGLYSEFKEFENLDDAFMKELGPTLRSIINAVVA